MITNKAYAVFWHTVAEVNLPIPDNTKRKQGPRDDLAAIITGSFDCHVLSSSVEFQLRRFDLISSNTLQLITGS